MPSSKFLETARRIIREKPEVFEALLEFERTKQLPKTSYRQRVNFTIDSALLRAFKRSCHEKNLNMSRVIETCIMRELGMRMRRKNSQ